MKYKYAAFNPDQVNDYFYHRLDKEDTQDHFSTILSELNNQQNEIRILNLLKLISVEINQNGDKLIPYLPCSMEIYFFGLIKTIQNIPILSQILAILNFLTKDKSICERFNSINTYEYLIQDILFSNEFSDKTFQEFSMNLTHLIYHLVEHDFSQNANLLFVQNFFEKYPISSFMKSKIDIIDKINFLILFSKYSLTPDISSEIVKQISKQIIVKEMAGQSSWIMYYIIKNDINNVDLFFSYPKDNIGLFSKLTKFFEEQIKDEIFYMGYLKFCITALLHLDEENESFQKIIASKIPSKVLQNFELFTPSSECKYLFIRFLNILIKYDQEMLNDDFILEVIDLSNDSKISTINQAMIFLMKIIPDSSVELITKIFRSDFFISCMQAIGSNIDIIVLSKIFFLIFEKLEPIPELFDEYINLHADYNTVEEFDYVVDKSSSEENQNIKYLIDYWEKLRNAVSKNET